jgi:RNA polymerase sigma-70 factor (ECF subfamily)
LKGSFLGVLTEKEFLDLTTRHQKIIHKVCRLFTANPDDHADLFQEITIKLWLGFNSYQGTSSFTTWMYRVALNTAISMKRKERIFHNTQPLSPHLDAPEEDEQVSEYEISLLYQAIGQLDPVEKAIILLYLEEKSYQEIGEIMGITKSHVGVKLVRTKRKLETLMKERDYLER